MANRILSLAPMAERERPAVAAVPARKLRLFCMRVSLTIAEPILSAWSPVLTGRLMLPGFTFRVTERKGFCLQTSLLFLLQDVGRTPKAHPGSQLEGIDRLVAPPHLIKGALKQHGGSIVAQRSEEHTAELQSLRHLV